MVVMAIGFRIRSHSGDGGGLEKRTGHAQREGFFFKEPEDVVIEW